MDDRSLYRLPIFEVFRTSKTTVSNRKNHGVSNNENDPYF